MENQLILSLVLLIALLAFWLGDYATRAGSTVSNGRNKGRRTRNSAASGVDPVVLLLTLLGIAKPK